MSFSSTLSMMVFAGFLVLGATKKTKASFHPTPRQTVAVDTLPALNTIREEDIDSVDASFKDKTITVARTNGETLVYQEKDWKPFDDWNSRPGREVNEKISRAIGWLTRTYTKAEQAPAFPGGQQAWESYLKEYCRSNKAAIKKAGEGIVYVQFIVDQHGVLLDVEPIGTPPAPLAAIAINAVSGGPRWIPATQNGRVVVCYQKQAVKISL